MAAYLPQPTMGVYADPSQLGAETQANNDANAYIFGTAVPDLKAQAQAQKAQAAAYNPYYKTLLQQDKTPKLDMSASANWAEGLGKGLGNVYGLQHQRSESRQDDAAIKQWQDMLAGEAQQSQQQADLLAQQQQAQTQHILQQYGPDAAFAYQLDPNKYGEALGTHFGALPTVIPEASGKSYGEGIGQGDAHRDNITANDTYATTHGAPPEAANAPGGFTPQQSNLREQLYGKPGEDMVAYHNRVNQSYITQQEANAAGYRPAQASASLTTTNLGNISKQLDIDKQRLTAQFDPANMENDAKLKYLSVADKTRLMAHKDRAMMMMDAWNQQIASGKTPPPADAAAMDQAMKAAGISSNYLAMLREIQNPKAGQALKQPSADNAMHFVTTPSGIQYNPATGQTIHPGQQPAAKPAAKPQPAKPVAQTQRLSDLLPPAAQGALARQQMIDQVTGAVTGGIRNTATGVGDLLHSGTDLLNNINSGIDYSKGFLGVP